MAVRWPPARLRVFKRDILYLYALGVENLKSVWFLDGDLN